MATSALFVAVVCAVLSLHLINAEKVPFYPCKGQTQSANITEVDVTPCPTPITCGLKKGTNVIVGVTFTTGTAAAANVTTVVHGIVGGIRLPFNTAYTDACATAGIHCPLQPKTSVVYTAQLSVLKVYPEVKVMVQWELKDQSSNEILCFEVAAEIVA